MKTKSDEELMATYALSGDPTAFRLLYERHAAMLSALIRRRLQNDADVEDVLQQTFLHLHRARHDFRAGERFRPWLVTIAMNVCRDLGRRRMRRPEHAAEMDLLAAAEQPPLGRELEEERGPITAALGRLPETLREILVAHYFEDRRLSEIAETLALNATTVRVRAHRACKRLRLLIDATAA